MAEQRLPRSARVRRRADFERAYDSGQRVHARFMIVFLVENGGLESRFGVAATRRIGNAVTRNRAKRLAREVFRRHRVIAGLDVVIVPRAEIFNARFSAIEADFIAAIARPARVRTEARPARSGSGGRHRRR